MTFIYPQAESNTDERTNGRKKSGQKPLLNTNETHAKSLIGIIVVVVTIFRPEV